MHVRALFEQPYAGDEALLALMRLRFEQAGLGAELHARDPAGLERVLGFAPDAAAPPTVHLDRALDLLDDADRAAIAGFVHRFDGRIAGFVVHDQRSMAGRTDALVDALRALDDDVRGLRAMVWLEYAAGHPLDWFAEVGARVSDLPRVGQCVDIGHVGLHAAHRALARAHPDLDFGRLRSDDDLLAGRVDAVEAATEAALPAVLRLVRHLSVPGKPLHLHLHDAHPLVPGLSDHRSFLTRLPVPFVHRGRRSLPTMYGPQGLRTIVDTAIAAAHGTPPSLMLEIHQTAGRRPLDDAAPLFAHWSDPTNAERTNHRLAVLSENARLL